MKKTLINFLISILQSILDQNILGKFYIGHYILSTYKIKYILSFKCMSEFIFRFLHACLP